MKLSGRRLPASLPCIFTWNGKQYAAYTFVFHSHFDRCGFQEAFDTCYFPWTAREHFNLRNLSAYYHLLLIV